MQDPAMDMNLNFFPGVSLRPQRANVEELRTGHSLPTAVFRVHLLGSLNGLSFHCAFARHPRKRALLPLLALQPHTPRSPIQKGCFILELMGKQSSCFTVSFWLQEQQNNQVNRGLRQKRESQPLPMRRCHSGRFAPTLSSADSQALGLPSCFLH